MTNNPWLEREQSHPDRSIDDDATFVSVPAALAVFAADELATYQNVFERADRGVLFLLDKSAKNLIIIGAWGMARADLTGRAVTLKEGVFSDVVNHLRVRPIDRMHPVPRVERDEVAGVLETFDAEVCVFAPLSEAQKCVGMVALFSSDWTVTFGRSELSQLVLKGRAAGRKAGKILSRPDVNHWYHVTSEALEPAPFTSQDVFVLLEAFGISLTTQSPRLAQLLKADVGEAVRGLGVRVGEKRVGGARRYSLDELKTILNVFGVEITAGAGALSDILTTDVRDLVRRSPRRRADAG